ncbi:hypothetical protein Btru_050573 [Bulinus truncatus]|nr:hypothetical protein Btru_050573 [Bulinus truncatus]
MMSIVILRKSGLSKPSNIPLLGMVVADSMTQLKTTNLAEILQIFGPNHIHHDMWDWQYGNGVSYFLIISDIMFYFFGNWGRCVNTTLPMVITVEGSVMVIYVPMILKKIITYPRWINAIVAFVIWLLLLTQATPIYYPLMPLPDFLKHYDCLLYSRKVTTVRVCFGCVLVGVKLKITQVKRIKLTSSEVPWSARKMRALRLMFVFRFIAITVKSTLGHISFSPIYVQLTVELKHFNELVNASCNCYV